MDHITIAIPTRNRLGKLAECLRVIPREPWVRVVVGCDGDFRTAQALTNAEGDFPHILVISPEHIGSMALCNLMSPLAEDGLLCLCDDMFILPGALEAAIERFNAVFPDDDGVLGIHQTGISSYAPTGVCLMGKKFLDRYPGKQVFNTAYGHFGDVEIFELANKLGKYKFGGQEVAVYHHHEEDQTHHDGRKHKVHDAKLRQERRDAGQIWGLTDDHPVSD